jgi:hypothetical protein
MLFRADALRAIEAGTVSVAFRRWRYARVRVGSRLRTLVGVLAVTAVTEVSADDLDTDDARRAGFDSVEALRADIPGDAAYPLFRVELEYAGADPRIALRASAELTGDERDILVAKLDRMDATSRRGPWTRAILRLIAARPATRAADLAGPAGYADTPTFKRDVRRLKELGLTESLEVGYQISPRGAALLRGDP